MVYWILIPLCVLLAVGLYFGLTSSGVIPGTADEPYRSAPRSTSSSVYPKVPRPRELPQGCLIALIVAAVTWFIAWGVLLVLALNLLRSPA